MRKPRTKTRPYAIYYRDGSYLVYDLTDKDYEALKRAVSLGCATDVSVGLLVTTDIRAIIIQKPAPMQEPDKPAVPDMSPEDHEWLKRTLADVHGEEADYQ